MTKQEIVNMCVDEMSDGAKSLINRLMIHGNRAGYRVTCIPELRSDSDTEILIEHTFKEITIRQHIRP